MATKEFKVDEMVMRCAAFMAGKVQAICNDRARVDGFGRQSFGHTKTVGYSEKAFDTKVVL